MTVSPTMPGLYFQATRPRTSPSPLRSDVAGFIGRTCRGRIGRAGRVEGWRGYVREYGGLLEKLTLPYAIRGYFENGGEVAYVVRVAPDDPRTANQTWTVGRRDPATGVWKADFLTSGGLRAAKYRFVATSPGTWAAGLSVEIEYLRDGLEGPIVDLTVRQQGEATERIRGLNLARTEPGETLEERVAQESILIRVAAEGDEPLVDPLAGTSQRRKRWNKQNENAVVLELPDAPVAAGTSPTVLHEYLGAARVLADQPEVAIVAVPSLQEDLPEDSQQEDVINRLILDAQRLQDRIVLVDAPQSQASVDPQGGQGPPAQGMGEQAVLDFVDRLRRRIPRESDRRAAAVYYPGLWVRDPLGGVDNPLRPLPPSAHVAGVISRADRSLGPHHTPANLPILDVVDVVSCSPCPDGALLTQRGVNLVRCQPGRGLMVWGGRTLDLSRQGRFLAHRRLIHRLIRAIRLVAGPIVFDTNGPEAWLTLVRAVTTVLLEAYRAGALCGGRPEEAFRVRCDEGTNPLAQREEGQLICEIEVAPTAPMEFITLRIALGKEGQLEVFDT